MRKRSKNHPEVRHRNKKPRVAFICVHNSCRSQIAEALGRKLAFNVVASAGDEVRCPNVPSEHSEDWGIPYPTGKEDDEFFGAVDEIELRAPMLMERLIR